MLLDSLVSIAKSSKIQPQSQPFHSINYTPWRHDWVSISQHYCIHLEARLSQSWITRRIWVVCWWFSQIIGKQMQLYHLSDMIIGNIHSSLYTSSPQIPHRHWQSDVTLTVCKPLLMTDWIGIVHALDLNKFIRCMYDCIIDDNISWCINSEMKTIDAGICANDIIINAWFLLEQIEDFVFPYLVNRLWWICPLSVKERCVHFLFCLYSSALILKLINWELSHQTPELPCKIQALVWQWILFTSCRTLGQTW